MKTKLGSCVKHVAKVDSVIFHAKDFFWLIFEETYYEGSIRVGATPEYEERKGLIPAV